MTREEKELLLKDLCARLPYNVKGLINYWKCGSCMGIKGTIHPHYIEDLQWELITIKPYLRPLSSMTEEEKKEYHRQADIDLGRTAESLREQLETGTLSTENRYTPQYCHIDWLNAHHFDYRGLIPTGLANEAPEGMYGVSSKQTPPPVNSLDL